MNRKLFAFDMDGTLITSDHTISKKTQEALKWIEDNGHILVIATGRSAEAAQLILKDYDFNFIGLFNNGTIIKKPHHDPYQRDVLESDYVRKFFALAKKYKCIVHFSHKGGMYSARLGMSREDALALNNSGAYYYLEHENQPHEVEDALEDVIFHQVTMKNYPDIIKKVYEELDEWKHKYSIMKIQGVYIDTVPQGISKYSSILKIAKEFNISKQNIYTFGDSHNDISMVHKQVNGVAMGNAVDELKEAAKYITDTNNNEGIYKFFKTQKFF